MPFLATFHEHLAAAFLDAVVGNSIWATAVRSVFIYLFALVLVRAGQSRMLSEATVFDIILAFVLGSMLSRTINGSAPVLPTVAASIILVALHALFGRLAYHSHAFGNLVKGKAHILIRDGAKQEHVLHAHHISDHDLEEAIHKAGLHRLADVKLAHLERDGSISIVPAFRVLEVELEEGVQRIRIEV